MEDKRFLFEEDSVPHALWVMAMPAIASQLITLVYNLADTWFVGRTNNPQMVAGCSLVLPVYMLTIVLSNIYGVGGGKAGRHMKECQQAFEDGKVCQHERPGVRDLPVLSHLFKIHAPAHFFPDDNTDDHCKNSLDGHDNQSCKPNLACLYIALDGCYIEEGCGK